MKESSDDIEFFSEECKKDIYDFSMSELKEVGFTTAQSAVISALLGASMDMAIGKAIMVMNNTEDCESCLEKQKKNKK